MKHFLETHQVKLTTIGPVFIGSGESLMKKEYILDRKKRRVSIINPNKFFQFLEKQHKLDSYEQFILKENAPLHVWLKKQNVSDSEIKQFLAYELDSGDIAELNTVKTVELFQKDLYGKPYIPGSSLKGAIRTALLGDDIYNTPELYGAESENIRNVEFKKRISYLKKEINRVEQKFFFPKNRPETRRGDAVNDVMSGLRISDSKPLSVEDLTLCQKIDVHVKGNEKELPIVRECLKPETEVQFIMTIDRTECKYTIEQIRQSINGFLKSYNELFLKSFSNETLFEKDVIYLGGGVGFASKTVTHPLLKDNPKRIQVVSEVVNNTLSKKAKIEHKHNQDRILGVSPHTCKLTQFDGGLYQMGACEIEIM